jgi:hypothetical protein
LAKTAQRSMVGHPAARAAEHSKVIVEAGHDLLRCHRDHARGGQFDGQRQSIEITADRSDGVEIVGSGNQFELWIHRTGSFDEQPDGLRVSTGRDVERRDRPQLFAGDAKILTRCGEERHGLGVPQDRLDELASGFDDVFAVVDDDEQRLALEGIDDTLGHRPARTGGDVQHVGQQRRYGGGNAGRRQFDDPCPVGEPVGDHGRHLGGETGLTDTSGSGQRDEALVQYGGGELPRLLFASDERRRGRQEVAVDRTERAQRWEPRFESLVDDLRESDRRAQISKGVDAEIDVPADIDEGRSRFREENLAAVAGSHDSSGMIEGGTEVVVVACLGVAGCDAHADRQFECVLRLDRCVDGIQRGPEHCANSVACVFED